MLLGIFTFLVGSQTFGDVQKTCGDFSALNYSSGQYCVYRDPQSTNLDVIYELHGLGGYVESWQGTEAYQKVRARWTEKNLPFPTVVSLSFGKAWLVVPKNKKRVSGLYEFIVDWAVPYIEEKIIGPVRGKRTLLGVSMGGFNAIEIFARKSKFFKRLAVTCPAIATVSPYASRKEIKAYKERTGAKSSKVFMALLISRSYFGSEAEYEKNSPQAALENNFQPTTDNQVYLSTALTDHYGFQEGIRALKVWFQNHGTDITYVEHEGWHCNMEPNSLADFLIN